VAAKAKPSVAERKLCAKVIRAGNYLSSASAHAGISEKMLDRWMEQGEQEEKRRTGVVKKEPRKTFEPELLFYQAITKALHDAEVESVIRIRAIARDKDTSDAVKLRAEQFLLERRHPERWAKRLTNVDGLSKGAQDFVAKEKDTDHLLASAKQGLEPGQTTGPLTRQECIHLLTAIARGEVSTIRTSARGDMYLQPPTFRERHEAIVTVMRELEKEPDAVNASTPTAGIWRLELH